MGRKKEIRVDTEEMGAMITDNPKIPCSETINRTDGSWPKQPKQGKKDPNEQNQKQTRKSDNRDQRSSE